MTLTPELDKLKRKGDMVHNPSHYQLFPDLEVIKAIQKILTLREYRGYLKGNILKYRLRAGKKGASEITIEDIRKSMKYEEFLRELESESSIQEKEEEL